MKYFRSLSLTFIIVLASFIVGLAQEVDHVSDHLSVFEVSIREVVDTGNYEQALAEQRELLQGVDGYLGSLEYTTFFSMAPEMSEGQVFTIGVTEWASLDAYESARAMSDDAVVAAYQATINEIRTVVIEPFVIGEIISLSDFPQAGQVFEVAIRDLSAYEDPVDFLRSIRGFTDALGEEEGVLREYEWVSVDGATFVGMTQYASMEAFQSASQSEAVLANPATQLVFAHYPPLIAQMGVLSE